MRVALLMGVVLVFRNFILFFAVAVSVYFPNQHIQAQSLITQSPSEKERIILGLFEPELIIDANQIDEATVVNQRARLVRDLVIAISESETLKLVEIPNNFHIGREVIRNIMTKVLSEEFLETVTAQELITHRKAFLEMGSRFLGRPLSPIESLELSKIHSEVLATAAVFSNQSIYEVTRQLSEQSKDRLRQIGLLPENSSDPRNRIFNGWYQNGGEIRLLNKPTKPAVQTNTPSPSSTQVTGAAKIGSIDPETLARRTKSRKNTDVNVNTTNTTPLAEVYTQKRKPNKKIVLTTPEQLSEHLDHRFSTITGWHLEGNSLQGFQNPKDFWSLYAAKLVKRAAKESLYDFPITIKTEDPSSVLFLFTKAIYHYQNKDPILRGQMEAWMQIATGNLVQTLPEDEFVALKKEFLRFQAFKMASLALRQNDSVEDTLKRMYPDAKSQNEGTYIHRYLTNAPRFSIEQQYWFRHFGLVNYQQTNILDPEFDSENQKNGRLSQLVAQASAYVQDYNQFISEMEPSEKWKLKFAGSMETVDTQTLKEIIQDLIQNPIDSPLEWKKRLAAKGLFFEDDGIYRTYQQVLINLQAYIGTFANCSELIRLLGPLSTAQTH